MKKIAFLSTALILLSACGQHSLSQTEKQTLTAEEHAHVLLKDYAANSNQCSKEMSDLVAKEGGSIETLILNTKKLLSSLETSSPADSSKKPSFDQMRKNIFAIVTSDQFMTVLNQTSDLVATVASNETVLKNLIGIHQAIQKEDGDRLAEILTLAASDPSKLQTFLEAGRTWLCSDHSNSDLLGFIYAPKTLWDLGGPALASNAIYLTGHGQFVPNSLELQKTLLQIEVPSQLKKFVEMVKKMMPKDQGFCQIENLNAYLPHFQLVVELFKAPADPNIQRPLRAALNLLSRLHTMSDSNQCTGLPFDALQKEDIKSFLVKTSGFIKDKQTGLVGILQRAKPR